MSDIDEGVRKIAEREKKEERKGMNIQEATKKAMEENGYITRKGDRRFGYITPYGGYRIGVIKPSNSHDTCAIMTLDEKGRTKNYCRNWNPTADDLMADDWSVVHISENKQFELQNYVSYSSAKK